MAPKGAELLVQGLRDGVHLPPLHDVGWAPSGAAKGTLKLQHAPKITPEDRHIIWDKWTAEEILRRQRVLGDGLWDLLRHDQQLTRVIMHGFSRYDGAGGKEVPRAAGQLQLVQRQDGAEENEALVVHMCDGALLAIAEMTVEGRPRLPAHRAASKYGLLGPRKE